MVDITLSPPELTVRDLTVVYNNGHKALDNICFSLNQNMIYALLGSNGSGKSTLFKSIMGMVKPTKGEILLNQQPIKKALKQNAIAYVPQAEDIDWNFPILVEDAVMMGRYGHMNTFRMTSKKDKTSVKDAMERVNITHLAKRQIGELSGGQRKRVFLARALAQQAKILLLDEPFTGIDIQTEIAIIGLLKSICAEGCLILISTHNLNSIPSFANHILFINRSLIQEGPTDTIFTSENIERVFGYRIPNILSAVA